MTEPPRYADTGVGPDRGSTGSAPPTPRWVKVSAGLALVLVLVVAIGVLTGRAGPGHGPGRHGGDAPAGQPARSSPEGERHTPPSSGPDHGGQRP